jgi:ceramide glucosyltransferase
MDLQTMATALPTLFASSFHAMTCTTFLWALRRRQRPLGAAPRPSVTILKPVAGLDDELRENLESFAGLDYPSYEILFGVVSRADPAVPVVEAFLRAHPALRARLVLTSPAGGDVHNPKVAQLIDLTREAKGEVLVVSDANVRVPPTYLDAIVECLARPGVGLASSIIAGSGERTLGAALENAQLGAAVGPAVVTGHCLFGRTITVGKSMAMRAADLAAAGGWASVGGVLAEDDTLGQRFRQLGHRVELCLLPVHNRNVTATTRRTIDRHARWAKMRRGIVPTLFWCEPLSWPILVAAVVACVSPTPLAARLFASAVGLQVTGALLCHTLLRARRPLLLALLEPARVAVALASWCLAATSRRVSWRGNEFACVAGSRLVPLTPSEVATEAAGP